MPRIPRADAMRATPLSSLSRHSGTLAAPLVLVASGVGLLAALLAYIAFIALVATAWGLSEGLERVRRWTPRGAR